MPAPRRKDYDSLYFKHLWHSPATLAEIADCFGVSIYAVYVAAMRRGFPTKTELRHAND